MGFLVEIKGNERYCLLSSVIGFDDLSARELDGMVSGYWKNRFELEDMVPSLRNREFSMNPRL